MLVCNFRDTSEPIVSALQSVAGSKYEVHWDLRNTQLHGGLPQNRTRVFIVGILKHKLKKKLRWSPQVACAPLASIMSDEPPPSYAPFANLSKSMQEHVVVASAKIMSSGKDPFEHDYIIDIGSSQPYFTKDVAPTLTATRCSQRGYWSTKRFRR